LNLVAAFPLNKVERHQTEFLKIEILGFPEAILRIGWTTPDFKSSSWNCVEPPAIFPKHQIDSITSGLVESLSNWISVGMDPEFISDWIFSVVPVEMFAKAQIASYCNSGELKSFKIFMNKGIHPISITSLIGGSHSEKFF